MWLKSWLDDTENNLIWVASYVAKMLAGWHKKKKKKKKKKKVDLNN